MQRRLKQNALASNHKVCPNNAFLASFSVQMLYPTSILIFRLEANKKNHNETIHETKKELGFTVVGSVSSVSLSPRTNCHSDCVKHKATFLTLWALLGTLVCNVPLHIRERSSSQAVSIQTPGSQQEASHWPHWVEGEWKGNPLKRERQNFLYSRKSTCHFNSSFYTSTGLVPCLHWETIMEKHMHIKQAF